MSVKILGVYSVGDYVTAIYPNNICTNCPFFHDGAFGWCGWYKERISDPNRNDKCRVRKIEVEEV